jgi:hypothetical protein
MELYIATLSEPASPDVQFTEEMRFMVLAPSQDAAEAAFRDYAVKNFSGVDMGIKIEGGHHNTGHLQGANLQPGVVKPYSL